MNKMLKSATTLALIAVAALTTTVPAATATARSATPFSESSCC
jgi:hypothetical protein